MKGRIMAANKPAPIACTLTPNEFKDRAAWLSRLADEALLAHRIHGGTAHLLYRLEAKEAVEQLVRQEQACCSFLRFEMAQTVLGIEVSVTAPPEVREDAAALLAHLLPSGSSQDKKTVAPMNSSCGCGTSCGS
jgi:hypothetical protein